MSAPCKWAQFGADELIALMQRHYPGFPLEKVYTLPITTVYELLDAKTNHQKG